MQHRSGADRHRRPESHRCFLSNGAGQETQRTKEGTPSRSVARNAGLESSPQEESTASSHRIPREQENRRSQPASTDYGPGRILKRHAGADLDFPAGRRCFRDGAELRRVYEAIRGAEIHFVERVEEFGAELKFQVFGETEFASEREIRCSNRLGITKSPAASRVLSPEADDSNFSSVRDSRLRRRYCQIPFAEFTATKMPATPQRTATPRCHCQAIIVAARKLPNTYGNTFICDSRSAAACSRFQPQTGQYAFSPAGWVRPVNEVSLRIGAGESLGLVGESGSGKTMLSLAVMGLLPPGAHVSGEAWLHKAGVAPGFSPASSRDATQPRAVVSATIEERRNLTSLTEREWRSVRGGEIAMVFQEPMTSLNPVMRIGAQIEETIRAHEPSLEAKQVNNRILESLRRAVVPEPEVRAEQFPHQLSGGLRQRVMIAMALSAGPRLLIADEPTTALVVTVQKQILDLLDRLRRELKLGLLFITHDLGVVSQVADRVAVMYAGRIIEEGPAREVLARPRHPYTQGLLKASPTLERGALMPIPGAVPQLTALPPGCAFEPRCEFRRAECAAAIPALRIVSRDHSARCILV
jgi:peptide/nickel transport system ATP-binding protein